MPVTRPPHLLNGGLVRPFRPPLPRIPPAPLPASGRSRRLRVLVVFPTQWDRRQLPACAARWQDRFEVVHAEPADDDCGADLDLDRWVEDIARRYGGDIDGVMSSSDYPGAAAAALVAARLGLPGPAPRAVLAAQHKHESRRIQHRAAPEAVPRFDLVDPDRPDIAPATGFPCFLKPVKGAFSLLARRIAGPDEFDAFLASPEVAAHRARYVAIFQRLLDRYTDLAAPAGHFLAEEVLRGDLVTVEGFARAGEVEMLGVVDSAVDPATGSFTRFDYPSALPAALQERMAGIAGRVIAALGLAPAMFNVEMIHDPATGAVHVIEVNPRMCGQFADLYQHVDGRNGYEVALAVATASPVPPRRAVAAAAASVPLRVFVPSTVLAAPDAAKVRAVESRHPGTLVWSDCAAGQVLRDFHDEDGRSIRYGVINAGAGGRRALLDHVERVREELGWVFAPLSLSACPRDRR